MEVRTTLSRSPSESFSLAVHVMRFVSPLYHPAYAGRRSFSAFCFPSAFIFAKYIRHATTSRTGGCRRPLSDKPRKKIWKRMIRWNGSQRVVKRPITCRRLHLGHGITFLSYDLPQVGSSLEIDAEQVGGECGLG